MTTTDFVQRMKRDCLVRGSAHRIAFTRFREVHLWIGLPSALLATIVGSLATMNAGKSQSCVELFRGGLSSSNIECKNESGDETIVFKEPTRHTVEIA